jgi:Holliday junction resolvasome RuvABC ATP-dependent DNA helicase subunit
MLRTFRAKANNFLIILENLKRAKNIFIDEIRYLKFNAIDMYFNKFYNLIFSVL